MPIRPLSIPHALMLIALAGCEPTSPTRSQLDVSSEPRFGGSTGRPFRLVLVGNANPDFTQGPCNVVNTESGTGIAQHLGRVTWSSSEIANFCVDPNNPSTAAVAGTMVITAANGDQLMLSYTSTVTADFAGGTLTATGPYVVTGGTGRFADASGSGAIDVSGSLAPPFGVSGTFTGELGY